MKAIEKLFGVSVAVISVTTLITTVCGFIGFQLPGWALWAIGIVNMISLPLMLYSTIKNLKEKAEAARKLAKKASGKAEAVKADAAVTEAAGAEERQPRKVRPKPHPQQLAVKKAAAGNKPKKGKKKKK